MFKSHLPDHILSTKSELTPRAIAILAREVTGRSQTSACEVDWLPTRDVSTP
jgi:hypothetical protein